MISSGRSIQEVGIIPDLEVNQADEDALGFPKRRRVRERDLDGHFTQEDAADKFGVELVHRVYGRTDGVDKLFQLLRSGDELPPWAYMFSTHPSADRRIRMLNEHARTLDAAAPAE